MKGHHGLNWWGKVPVTQRLKLGKTKKCITDL